MIRLDQVPGVIVLIMLARCDDSDTPWHVVVAPKEES